ncbi:RNA polymerase sigma factor [Paludibaculum fermentans]|uniref:RNA polymerase sigma factor n=1 Tax=Paludibaculum fermentans TaxID=1473598 RepID=UPI003EB90FE5
MGQTLLACHASLYRYARALSRDPATAEELVQETFRRALGAKRGPFQASPDNVRPWAFTILRHIWQNLMRRQRRESFEELKDEAALGESPEVVLTQRLLRSEIADAIDALPVVLREVIVLREMEGYTYAEIAQVLNCPAGTVMSRLARARHSLRKLLLRHAPSSQEIGS